MGGLIDSAVSVFFSIRPRSLGGLPLNLSPYLMSVTRSKPLAGSSVGSWQATLKFDMFSSTQRAIEQKVQANIEDDDFGNLEFQETRPDGSVIRSPMEIMVETKTCKRDIDARGTSIVIWTLSGQDWSRCMCQGEIRLSAIFQSTTVEYITTAAGIQAVTKTIVPQRMPGFIDTQTWDQFSKIVVSGSSGSDVASQTLKNLLGVMLWGCWKEPGESGKTLIDRINSHKWQKFGPVDGSPWQLKQLISTLTITPDQVLRQYGCEAYNEIFYDYDSSDTHPAIVFRERPYSRRAWTNLPIVPVSPDHDVSLTASQSGNERYTVWKPMAAAVSLTGSDLLLDTAEGKIPIVDLSELKNHGVRPFEASDDYFPPISKPNAQFLEWYRIRIGKARKWYVNTPKMLTGSLTIKPADPRMRIGRRVSIPCEWTFNYGTSDAPDLRTVPAFEAYITNVTDGMTLDARGTMTTTTTIQFVRGQPSGGLPIPAISPWTTGAKIIKTRKKVGAGSIILGMTEYAVPFPVKWDFTSLRATLGIAPADVSVSRITIGETGSGSHAATIALYNKTLSACHFEIDGDGTIYQLFDPLTTASLHYDPTLGGAKLFKHEISIDLVGGGPIGFKVPQYTSLAMLVKVLVAHFSPDIPLETFEYRPAGMTLADWRVAIGSPGKDPSGVVARDQLSDVLLAPSTPEGDAGVWNQEIRPRMV